MLAHFADIIETSPQSKVTSGEQSNHEIINSKWNIKIDKIF
jgi:hypothetical protein